MSTIPTGSAPSEGPVTRAATLFGAAVLAATVGCGGAPEVDGVRLDGGAVESGLTAIDSVGLRARTAFLADDLLEGRAPGTRGGAIAAAYLASEFGSLGLEGPVDGGHLQTVPILGVTSDPELTFTSEDGRTRFRPAAGEDFVGWTGLQRESVATSGELAFVGYGIHAPELDHDDYRDVDVRGKVLLGLVNDPGEAGVRGFRGDTLTYYGRWTYKYAEAARRGAAGLILLHTPSSAGYGWPVVRGSWTGEQFELPLATGEPANAFEAWITEGAARRMLGMAGIELDSLVAAARRPDFRARPLPLRASARVRSRVRRMDSPNVLGLLRGADPELRDEVVVYTSHYDHLGVGRPADGDSVYNGARDNASGTAAILEVAEAFAGAPERPRRSVLFAAVTAEESGLLGSAHLAARPPVGHFVADINVDALNMYGRTRDVVSLGAGYSSLGPTFEAVGDHLGFEVRGDPSPGQGYFFRSDQFSFVNRGVPSLYIAEGLEYVDEPEGTGARREDAYRRNRYHRPSDELLPEHTMGGAEQQAEAAFVLGWVVANRTEPPTWNADAPFASPGEPDDSASTAGGAR